MTARSGDRHLGPDPLGLLAAVELKPRIARVVADPAYAATFAGQALLSLLVDLLARQFGMLALIQIVAPDIAVHEQAFPREVGPAPATLSDRLIALGREVAGPEIELAAGGEGRPDYVVLVGPQADVNVPADLQVRVAGEGWRAFASTGDAPPDLGAPSLVPFGPHLAACLAADRIYRHARGATAMGTRLIDLWPGGEPGPDLAGLELPIGYLIGVGAVGAAFLYTLAASEARGAFVGIDRQNADETNRNRLLSMRHESVGVQKVTLAADLIGKSKIDFFPNAVDWPAYYSDLDRIRPAAVASDEDEFRYRWVISAVDRNIHRRNIANVLPRHVFSGSTDGLVAQAAYCSMTGECECLACNHPIPSWSIETLRAELDAMSPEDRRDKILGDMGGSEADVAAVEDYLRDPGCAQVGEATLRRLGVEGGTDWTVGFVSVAAGIQLAALLVEQAMRGTAAVCAAGAERRVIFWGAPEAIRSQARRKSDCPLCGDQAAMRRFAARWKA